MDSYYLLGKRNPPLPVLLINGLLVCVCCLFSLRTDCFDVYRCYCLAMLTNKIYLDNPAGNFFFFWRNMVQTQTLTVHATFWIHTCNHIPINALERLLFHYCPHCNNNFLFNIPNSRFLSLIPHFPYAKEYFKML